MLNSLGGLSVGSRVPTKINSGLRPISSILFVSIHIKFKIFRMRVEMERRCEVDDGFIEGGKSSSVYCACGMSTIFKPATLSHNKNAPM
jgi:hypothetical protein